MPIPFNEWIPSRGTSGEYEYVNTKTGQFRTTLPNSKEEKTQNVEKSKKAALVTHSARQAKFNRTQAKRRNHSDETVKKINNIPIINVNKDGTFTNNYVRQMALSESSTKVYTPVEEFILANTALNPIFKLAGRGVEYGFAKYGTQQMKNWGRSRIFNRELNKNINKTNLTIPRINYTTLNYNPITKQQSNITHKNNYTENLIKLLGKGKDNKNLGQFNLFTQDFANYLKQNGVDISKFSNKDLLSLMYARQESITHPNYRHATVTEMKVNPSSTKSSYTLYNGDNELGSLESINNNVGEIYSRNVEKGVSEDLYNLLISRNPNGIISGERLLSPEITYKVWNKYPDKTIISNTGKHSFNTGRDITKQGESYTINDGPIIKLTTPSRSIIPLKSESIFHPSLVTNTGKLLPPDWNTKDIYKTLIPITIGYEFNK